MAKEIFDLWGLEEESIDGDINHYSFTISGDGGVGKSTFAHNLFKRLGGSCTFGFEDRFKGIGARVVPIDKHGWGAMDKYITQLERGLKAGKELPFSHVIIDPVGQAGDICERYVIEENGWEDMSTMPYGKGYEVFEEEFCGKIDRLRALGLKVDFVAHGKNETITPPRKEGYVVKMPDIQKRLKYLVKDSVDFLLYLTVERSTDALGNPIAVRRLYMQNYPEFSLKVPLDGFPDYIEWEGDVDEGVDKFIDAFNKAVEITREKKGLKAPAKSSSNEPIKVQEDTSSPFEVEEDDIDTLKTKAVERRDKLLESMTKQEVAKILKEELGTVKISEVEDIDILKSFVNG